MPVSRGRRLPDCCVVVVDEAHCDDGMSIVNDFFCCGGGDEFIIDGNAFEMAD